MESSDDESIATIGNICVDEYFDDAYCYDNVFEDDPTENIGIPIASTSSNPNDAPVVFTREIDETLRTSHTDIVSYRKRRLSDDAPVFVKNKRIAAVRARVAIVKSNPKRRTQKELEEEKRKIRKIEIEGGLRRRKPKGISIPPWIVELYDQ